MELDGGETISSALAAMHSSSDAQKRRRRRRKWHRYDLENVGPWCDDDEDEARTHSREGALSTVRWISQGDGQQEPDYTCTYATNEWGAGACRGESYIMLHTRPLYIYNIVLMNEQKKQQQQVERKQSHIGHTCCCCCSLLLFHYKDWLLLLLHNWDSYFFKEIRNKSISHGFRCIICFEPFEGF